MDNHHKNFDLITFDLDGTLCYPLEDFPSVFKRVFGVELDAVSKVWMDGITKNGPNDGLEAVKAVLNSNDTDKCQKIHKEMSTSWAKAQSLYPGVKAFLENLRKQFDGKMFILTNGPSVFQHEVIEHLGLDKLVDNCFATGDSEIAIRKPSYECFSKVLQKANTTADRSLFIGNSYKEDHLGSIGAGWSSIWVNPVVEPSLRDDGEKQKAVDIFKLGSSAEMSCVNLDWSLYSR